MVKKTSQFILSSAAVIAFIAVTLPPPAEAARQRPQGQAKTSVAHGGVRSGGGDNAARAANHQGNTQAGNRQNINNSKNVNNVRGGNNNINIDNSRDVNVNVDGGHGYYNNNHYDHPIAAAAAVTATVAVTAAVVGSIVNANQMPPNCVQVMRGNTAYMQCGSTWYQPQYQGSSVTYVVVNQP